MFLWFWPVWRISARADHLRTALQAAEVLWAVAAVVTLWTGVDYVVSGWKALKAQYAEQVLRTS